MASQRHLFSLALCLAALLLQVHTAVVASPLTPQSTPAGQGGAVATQNDPSLIDVNSSSFGGSKNSAGVGGGLAGSIEVCVAGDAVCLGDAGAAAAGILGNQAVGEGKATGANGTEGSVAQAETTGKGLGGAAAADAANLCVLKNCFGGGGAVGVGDYQAGADGGALKPASASSSSSAASTPSTVAANNNAAQAAKAAASSATGEAAKASSTSAASTGSNVAGTVKNAAQNVATTQGKGKARRCRRRLDSGAEESS